jgi:hypothetical protein
MADLVIRVGNLEETAIDHRGRLDELEGLSDIHSKVIDGIEQWRKGNGARGAEARLQHTENAVHELQVQRLPERVGVVECDITALQKIADGRITAAVSETVKTTLDARDKTAIAYIKAIGSLLGGLAGLAALAAILLRVFGG